MEEKPRDRWNMAAIQKLVSLVVCFCHGNFMQLLEPL